MTQAMFDPVLWRSEDYKLDFPEKAKIIEEYEEEMNKARNEQECYSALKTACKKLGVDEVGLNIEIVKYYGEDPYDIEIFEKRFNQKYKSQQD